jgi:hypothetical protein
MADTISLSSVANAFHATLDISKYVDKLYYFNTIVPGEAFRVKAEGLHESMKALCSVFSTQPLFHACSRTLPPRSPPLRYASLYRSEDSEYPLPTPIEMNVSYFDDVPGSLSRATSVIRPLAHVGLCSLASAAALEVGNHHTPWSPWDGCSASLATGIIGSSELYCISRTSVSAITFTAAATAIHHLNSGDRYQNCCLFAGITLGIGIGLSVCEGLEEALLRVLPWGILAGLLCSMLGHKILLHTKYIRHDHLDEKTWLCQDCDRGN